MTDWSGPARLNPSRAVAPLGKVYRNSRNTETLWSVREAIHDAKKKSVPLKIDVSGAWQTIQDMVNGLIALLPNLFLALIAFTLALLAGRGVRALVRRITFRYKQHRNLGLLLGRLAQGLIIFVGALVAFAIAIPSFKPAQVIQLLGISGVAIGFAFKDIFQNFLAGILLLLTEPFRIGDQIVAGGYEGTVEDIQTRATMIKTYDGRRVVIPNAELFTGSVVVNTAFECRRTEYEVGIGYGDDIPTAKRLILETLTAAPGVLADPKPDVLTIALAEGSVNLRARWWSLPQKGELLQVQDHVISGIKTALTRNGIDLPFPTQQILFHNQTEESDGDRTRQREGWPPPPVQETGADAPPDRPQAIAR